MDYAIRDLLLNVLFVLLPLFYYHLVCIDKASSPIRTSLISGSVGSLAIILCMTFPIQMAPGRIIDLRQIPLIVVTLYGGYRAGLISFTVLILYRFYIGGSGFYNALLVHTVLIAVLVYVAPFFKKQAPRKKIFVSLALAISGWAIAYLYSYFQYPFDTAVDRFIWLKFLIIQAITMAFLTLSIEFAHKNNQIRDELERTKKLQLVSELAASVSHEVRNPLTAARGFVQLMKQDSLAPEKRAWLLDMALEGIDHAEAIIGDFLSFANPMPEDVETLNVTQEVKYAAAAVTPSAAMQRVVVSIHAAKDCLVRGEREKFRQCIINLATNAVEAMPNGGDLKIFIFARGRKVMVRLQDDGIGMTQEQIDRLGTPFYSIKDKGTGLGTMVAYSNIQAMGGKIHVESKVGIGTSFILTLPSAGI